MKLPVKEDLRRIVLSKYFPFLFSLIVVGIVYFNELMSWPLLRFSNVFAGKNFIDLQYVLRRADCYKDISTEVYTYSIEAGWNSCFNYWYGETLLSVLSLLRIGLVDTTAVAYVIIMIFSVTFAFSVKNLMQDKWNHFLLINVSVILLSPIVMFLLQRGNIDLLMFSLIMFSWLLVGQGKQTLAFGILLIGALFKFYTLPALFVMTFYQKKKSTKVVFLIASLITCFLVLQSYNKVDGLQAQLTSMEQLFGFRFMSTWVQATQSYYLNPLQSWVIDILTFAISFIFVMIYAKRKFELRVTQKGKYQVYLLGTIVLFIYVFGTNVDYRLTIVASLSLFIIVQTLTKECLNQASRLTITISVLIALSTWLTYPSGKLQLLGDASIAILVQIVLFILLTLVKDYSHRVKSMVNQ